jgi:hypothetical protein
MPAILSLTIPKSKRDPKRTDGTAAEQLNWDFPAPVPHVLSKALICVMLIGDIVTLQLFSGVPEEKFI